MKKILYFLSIAVMAVSFASCRGPQGPQGEPGRDGQANKSIIDIQVNQNEWQYSNQANNNYFYAVINMPELNSTVYNDGMVKVYREYNTGASNASQIELPYVALNEFQAQDGTWGFFTEKVDYEFTNGSLTIFYTASDFDYELNQDFVPEAMHFRFVAIW